MNKKISVIVPIYNTKSELRQCLGSIASQTYKNLEIICIDDGSSDGSEKIVDEYAASDERFRVIHQENRGESNARNIGLQMATGEYIAFCDCDDWIDKDMYQTMMQEMYRENLDMVAASWYKEDGVNSVEIKNLNSVATDIFGKKQLLEYIYKRDAYRGFAYMWDKLYKKQVLCDARGKLILFDEHLRLGGDVVFLAEVALNVNRAKYIDRAFYHYYQRQDSGCHTKDVTRLRDWLKAYEIVIKRFEEEHVDMEIIAYVKRFLAYHSSNAAELAGKQNECEAKKEFQSLMKKYQREYYALNTQYPDRLVRYQAILEE